MTDELNKCKIVGKTTVRLDFKLGLNFIYYTLRPLKIVKKRVY